MERKLSKREWIAVVVAIGLIGYTLFGANITNLFKNQASVQDAPGTDDNDKIMQVNKTGNNKAIDIKDIKVGDGNIVSPGQTLKVHYLLALKDGTVLQNSKDFGTPFEFTLGAGQVIPGWEMGFEGMKVGGVRTIIIPPELGYGANQAGPIPPNSTLVFTVEVLEAK